MRRGRIHALGLARSALLIMAVMLFSLTTVFADTDGTELKISDQPDQLVLQLGVEWAGVEFELRTDAGVFPAPVIVDESGVLKMELGGSKTYTLSCLSSGVAVSEPGAEGTTQGESEDNGTPSESQSEPDSSAQKKPLIPATQLILFIGGMVVAIAGLLLLRYFKNRRSYDYGDSGDYDDEDDE